MEGIHKDGPMFITHFNPNDVSLKPKSFAEYMENEKKFIEVENLNRMRIAINKTEQAT